MEPERKRSLSLLTLAGMCSFLPFYWIVTSPDSGSDRNIALRFLMLAIALAGPGGFFGFAVSAYFVLYERFSEPTRLIAFIVLSTIAFWASMIVALPLIPLFGGEFPAPFKGSPSLSLPYVFGAGYIGAFLVMVTGRFAFGEQPSGRSVLGRALLLSLAGGTAALIGGLIDPSVVDAARSTSLEGISPLVTWPPVGAFLLGLLLNQTEAQPEPEPASPEDSNPSR